MKTFLNKCFVSNSEIETEKIAVLFSKTVKAGQIILLTGDLGAGKTAFVRGFVKGKKLDESVVSPTFTIMNCYGNEINHIDLYRLSGRSEFETTGIIEELFSNKISLIEWPEIVGFDYFDENAIVVKIEKVDENKRKITFMRNKNENFDI